MGEEADLNDARTGKGLSHARQPILLDCVLSSQSGTLGIRWARDSRNRKEENRRKLIEEAARRIAENLLKQRLKEIGADSLGPRAFVGPQQDPLKVARMKDVLEADFRFRGFKSLKQAHGHLGDVRSTLGDFRAVDVNCETISR